jgi:glycosyltransferase involved in cell wall biosynthesis
MRQVLHDSPRAPDLSVVLNLHREAGYLARTFASLEAAVRHADLAGIACELVVVLDRPDTPTRAIVEGMAQGPWVRVEVVTVDNGSLGLSRNDGIACARGEWVMTADADDLISFNLITETVAAARARGGRALFFPQYFHAFGMDPHLYEMHPLSVVTPQAMVTHHPYVSRFLARRADLAGLRFHDLRLSTGFAYEDWHFNLQAVAAGLDLAVVPDTAIYYRQRPGSLLREADRMSMGVTAHCAFFDPRTYLRLTEGHVRSTRGDPAVELRDGAEIRGRYLRSAVLVECLLAASRIDPGIDPIVARWIHSFSNAGISRKLGRAWRNLCLRMGDARYDEVLLVPFLTPGGGEKYVLSVMDSILDQNPDARLLIVAGQPLAAAHHGLDRLHPRADFLDLCAEDLPLSEAEREVLTLRILQTAGARARVHIKTCPYAQGVLRRFGKVLTNEVVYYRFCDTHVPFFGEWVPRGDEFDFLSDCAAGFGRIVCDNEMIRRADTRRLATLRPRYATLYNHVGRTDMRPPRGAGSAARTQVLWASRLDGQKRPELLLAIARAAAARVPGLMIEVWGSAVLDAFDPALFRGLPNLRYRGPFNGFAALPVERYGVFLYTSAFDGLPNILLEAMAEGLPCIAPALGGIPEAVDDTTGLPVDPALPDPALVEAYVAQLARCAAEPDLVDRLRAGALARVAERHSRRRFDAEVARLFAPLPIEGQPA